MPILFASRFGLNTNDRHHGQDPLSCKLFFEASIDSCNIGKWPADRTAYAGTSTIADISVPFKSTILFTGTGKIERSFLSPIGTCTSSIQAQLKGFAAAPIIRYLPTPIVMNVFVAFIARRNSVTVMWRIDSRTQFPDYEFRVNIGAVRSSTFVTSGYPGPEIGLSVPTVSGPRGQRTGYAETSEECCGSC